MPTAASVRSSPDSRPGRGAGAGIAGAALVVLALLSCRTPAPPPTPEPEAPARETVVSWQIEPSGGYRPDTGFVTLDFVPSDLLAGTDVPPPEGG